MGQILRSLGIVDGLFLAESSRGGNDSSPRGAVLVRGASRVGTRGDIRAMVVKSEAQGRISIETHVIGLKWGWIELIVI